MTDLSHWDFAESFSAAEAAALMLGFDPTGLPEMSPAIKPLFERMKSDYVVTWNYYLSKMRDVQILGIRDDLPETAIVSDAIKLYLNELDCGSWDEDELKATFLSWIWNAREGADFQAQQFSRTELSRWLSAIGMGSVYQFDRSQAAVPQTSFGRWPWGDHHTELLGHLEAAALRHWVNYDPTDATSAPTNKDVAKWLMTERKVSQKTAESIASMLRPDGLPTGPRK